MYPVPTGTGSAQTNGSAVRKAFVVMSTVLLGTGSVYGIERAETWRSHVQPRVAFVLERDEAATDAPNHVDIRTPVQHIENIRSVLNPSVSDLASLFDISRQAIYKWLSGDSTPEPEKTDRIIVLSHIADAFNSAEIARSGALIKMKTFNGRSLLDLVKSGEDCSEQVATLIAEAKFMKTSYERSGLSSSKAKATSDWQSSVSIPGSPEHT